MTRRWNSAIWFGFAFILVGLLSYEFVFVRWPITRDFPWANLLLLAAGMIFLVVGLRRAFGQPQIYRGKIFGSILTAISALLVAAFCFGALYFVRLVPRSAHAPKVGEKAPVFTLPDNDGKEIALADLLAPNGAVLIFYRGHW